ncbi:MAG: M48 family metallopeptidase [Anaerolineae bacterium]
MKHKTEDFRSLEDFGSLPPIEIVQQERRTLAMRVTPAGIQVLIPADLDADSPHVQAFIEAGLQKLKPSEPDTSHAPLTVEDLNELATMWSECLGVEIRRVQVRAMRTKWASCSSNGILTLSADLLELPPDLVDYVICHELGHLRVPDHGKGFQALMGCCIPDWQDRKLRLARWIHFPA